MRRVRALALVLLATACSEAERGSDDPSPEVWSTRAPSPYLAGILERCAFSGIEPIHETALPSSCLEVRIWGGFGLSAFLRGGHPLEGLVLRRDGDESSGVHYPRAPGSAAVTPLSGWPSFWRAVQEAGLYELPDCRDLDGWIDVLDGIAFVIEIRQGDRYRSYSYDNPAEQDRAEARRFLNLLAFLRAETGFDTGLPPVQQDEPLAGH